MLLFERPEEPFRCPSDVDLLAPRSPLFRIFPRELFLRGVLPLPPPFGVRLPLPCYCPSADFCLVAIHSRKACDLAVTLKVFSQEPRSSVIEHG
eukprot:5110960-Amphidinium_carterae.1